MESLTIGNCWKSIGAAAISLTLFVAWQVASPGTALAVPAGYNLVFSEEFSGSDIDDTRFRPIWSDYPGSDCKSDAIDVGGGTMKLKVYTDENDDSWGSQVGTDRTYSYTYGYCEARVKFCNDSGVNMAFWLDNDSMLGDPPGVADDGIEIDIVEQRAKNSSNDDCSDMFHIQLHAGGYGGGHYQYGPSTQPTVNNLEDTWHLLQCEWDEDGYTIWCDSVQKWSYHPDWWDDFLHGEFKCSAPEWLIFGAPPCGGWAGDILEDYGSLETTDTYMEVDYCRVYQKTPMFWKQGSGGSGTWNTATANWSNSDGGSAIVYDSNNDVYLRGTGGTITIANGYTPNVRGLHFESDGYTITGSSLTLWRQDVCVEEGLTGTIASAVSGWKGLTVLGLGKLVLSGNNTYTGETIIKHGSVLNIQHANALGNTSDGTVVMGYSALEIQGGITTAAEPLTLAGPGINYDGALRSISGNNTYTGLLKLEADTYIKTEADSLTISNAGTIFGLGHKLYVIGNGDTTINSLIFNGTGGLFKHGTGTLTLTRENVLNGANDIQRGTLAYGTNNVLGSGDLTVGEESWASGTVSMGSYSDTVGTVTLIRGSITGTGTLTSTDGFYVENGTIDVHLAGSVGLTKTDTATVTLSKVNYYTGTTTVSEGTLAYGVNNAIASGLVAVDGGTLDIGSYTDTVGEVTLASGSITGTTGTLTTTYGFTLESGTVSAKLGGSVDLAKITSGTVTLSGANTYTGTTTVYAGTLAYGANNAIYTGGVTVNGGTLNIGSYSDTVGTVTLSSGSITGTTGTLTGSSYALQSGTVGAIIGGSGAVTKSTGGTVTMTKANTYTGATTVSAGSLRIQSNNALGTTAHGTTVSSGAALEIQGGINYSTAETVTLYGTGVSNGGAMRNISGNNTFAGQVTFDTGDARINSDSGELHLSYAGTMENYMGDIIFGGNGDIVVDSNIQITYGNVVKDGSGTLTLSGTNTYTGLTSVEGGTLELTSSGAWNRVLSYGGCDIQQGQIYFDSTALEGTISSLLATSYAGGDWDTGQFLCSTANEYTGLGWVTDDSGVTVRYALYGDLNLDGYVTSAEVSQIFSNLNMSGADWSDGDMDYDGSITYDDWYLAMPNSGDYQSLRLEIGEVPEPSTIALLATGLLGMLAYAWRKRK